MADFESKYTGPEIEQILDYASRQQYKVNLEIKGMPIEHPEGYVEHDGTTPYIDIYGLPEDVDLDKVVVKLFRRGVFQRYHQIGGGEVVRFKQRGWIHPRHGDVPNSGIDGGFFTPPFREGEYNLKRNILSEFHPTSYRGGRLKPVAKEPIRDYSIIDSWSNILGSFGRVEVIFDETASQYKIYARYTMGKKLLYYGKIYHNNLSTVFSKCLYSMFGMAVYYNDIRISPIIPFNVSITCLVYGDPENNMIHVTTF